MSTLADFPVQISDPRSPPPASWADGWSDALALPLLRDPRDVVFSRLIARHFTQTVPLAVAMYLLPWWAALACGVPYLAFVLSQFGGRTILAVHAVTHRPLFLKGYGLLDKLITHVFPLFVGLTPGAYHPHHVLMHHTDDNGDDDTSSTINYTRDNVWDFAHYWARFAFFGYFHMTSWLIRQQKWKSLQRMVLTELVVYSLLALAVVANPVAGLFVFVAPYLLMRFFLMAGNWCEHAFVDCTQPTNDYRNSVNLLNTVFNSRCYNAGYHLIHHRAPGLHWADTLTAFEKELPKMIEQDSILFDGVPNNQVVWWKLMNHDYGYLADHLLDLGDRRPTRDAKIAFLQERVRNKVGVKKGLLERREHRPVSA